MFRGRSGGWRSYFSRRRKRPGRPENDRAPGNNAGSKSGFHMGGQLSHSAFAPQAVSHYAYPQITPITQIGRYKKATSAMAVGPPGTTENFASACSPLLIARWLFYLRNLPKLRKSQTKILSGDSDRCQTSLENHAVKESFSPESSLPPAPDHRSAGSSLPQSSLPAWPSLTGKSGAGAMWME